MPTNRRHRQRHRRRAYPDWLLDALRTGRSEYEIDDVLTWRMFNLPDSSPEPNRYRDRRISGLAARQLWERYGETLLDEHIAKWPGTRPVPFWWLDQTEIEIKRGTTLDKIEHLIGTSQRDWLREHGYLTPAER